MNSKIAMDAGAGRWHRALVLVTAGCALAYTISKVHFALTSRLGIFGGPRISPEDLAAFDGPGAVARAQWGNAAAGAVIVLLTLLALLRRPPSRRRWLLRVMLALVGAALIAVGLVMIVRGATLGIGGYPFGAFSIAWGALELASAGTLGLGTAPAGGLTRD